MCGEESPPSCRRALRHYDAAVPTQKERKFQLGLPVGQFEDEQLLLVV
jgi:hypothetical protein